MSYEFLYPRVLWVGVGCNKGTSKELIQAAIRQVFRDNQLGESLPLLGRVRMLPRRFLLKSFPRFFGTGQPHRVRLDNRTRYAIAGIGTIDNKATEAGLIELCREWNLPLKTFSADVLRTVCVPNPSKVVTDAVLTPSVAEAAALCAAADFTNLLRENQEKLVTSSGLAVRLLVSKQIFRSSNQNLKSTFQNQKRTVTIAVAEVVQEYGEITDM